MQVNRVSKRSVYLIIGALIVPAIACCLWLGTTELRQHPRVHLGFQLWCLGVFLAFLIYLMRHRANNQTNDGQKSEVE